MKAFKIGWDHLVISHMRLSVAQLAKRGVMYVLPSKGSVRLTEYISQAGISEAKA